MPNLAKTLRFTSLIISLVTSLVACSKGESKPKADPKTAEHPAVTNNSIAVFVDDQQVGTLAPEQVKLWPRLDTLVPVSARRLGTWQTITLKADAKSTDLQQPSATHPELVPALFPNDAGAPSFGMFDPVELAKHGKPALREDGIHEVRIALTKGGGRGQNDTGQGGGQDPRAIELTIKTPKSEQVVKGDKLLETPRESQPGETGEGKGWTLASILDHAGVKGYEKLLLTGEGGTNLTLEKQDLDPKSSIPFVKLNRQGALRFRVFKKQGDTWQPGQDLRGLVRVEVLK
jgi:hypothetical protein